MRTFIKALFFCGFVIALPSCSTMKRGAPIQAFNIGQWETLETLGAPSARHEAAFVEHKGFFYLILKTAVNPAKTVI